MFKFGLLFAGAAFNLLDGSADGAVPNYAQKVRYSHKLKRG
jgi:hypothetical protein